MKSKAAPMMLGRILLAFLFIVTLSCGHGPKKRPDIILVVPDALRAKQLPCYGYDKIETPNIDALAKESVKFKHCFVKVPDTLPSFSNLFSGMLFPSFGLLVEEKTLAEYLKENGYLTIGIVSSRVLWSSEFQDKGGIVNHFSRGFDEYLQDASLKKMPYHRENEDTTKDALAMLEKYKNSGKPIFLFVHYMDPHAPHSPSYDKEIEKIDGEFGRICDKLKEINRYDKSLVIFTSDHGDSLGNPQEDHGSPQGHGWFLYDEQVRPPLLFKFPREPRESRGAGDPRGPRAPEIKGAETIDQVVRNYDLMPTLLDYLDIPFDKKNMDGQSLLPAMSDGKDLNLVSYSISSANRVLPEGSHSVTFSVKGDIYVYIRGKFSSQLRELYNFSRDPAQVTNLVEQPGYTQILNKGRFLLHRFEKERESAREKRRGKKKRKTPFEFSPTEKKILESLGYLKAGAPSASFQLGFILMKGKLEGMGDVTYAGILRHPTWGLLPGPKVWPNMNDPWFPIKITGDGENGFYAVADNERRLYRYRPGKGFQSLDIDRVEDIAFEPTGKGLLILKDKRIRLLTCREAGGVTLKSVPPFDRYTASAANPVQGLVVSPPGNIFLIRKKDTYKFSGTGKRLKKYAFTAGTSGLFAVDAHENIFIAAGNMIHAYDKDGKPSLSFSAAAENNHISCVTLDPLNRLWVGTAQSALVNIFDAGGTLAAPFKYNFKEHKNSSWKPSPIKQLYVAGGKLYLMDNWEGILVYTLPR